jgi:vacuolar-type H+-ATPase subunit H
MIVMSTDYTQALKNIKEAEEASSRAIEEKKKALMAELAAAQEEASKLNTAARAEAEAYVAGQVEYARSVAEKGAEKLVATTQKDAQQIAKKKLGKAALEKIIEDILLSEFKGA